MTKQDKILKLIPRDARRVRVRTAKGHERYRAVDPARGDFDNILPTDEVVLIDGKPVIMSKKPGRPKGPPKTVAPTTPLNAERQQQKERHLQKDALIQRIDCRIKEEPDSVMLFVMRGLAQEVASLEFEQIEADAEGRSTSQLSLRRTNALKAIADNYDRYTDELVDLHKAEVAKVKSKLVHIQNTLELLREEMEMGAHHTGIFLTKAWYPIIQSLLDELRLPP